eukprot:5380552-Pyramimonas_sp.AAC.1
MDTSWTNGSPQPVTNAGGHRRMALNGPFCSAVHPSPRHTISSGFWPTACPAPHDGEALPT